MPHVVTMKCALRVLALVLVLVWVQADDEKEAQCEDLKKTIQPHDLHKVEGSWVLLYGISDGPKSHDLLQKVGSQHLTLHLIDNKTLAYDEKNFLRDQTHNCSQYLLNATVIEGTHEHEFKLANEGGIVVMNGTKDPFHDNATISFHKTCEHCLHIDYESKTFNNYFLAYVREGHHTNIALLTGSSHLKRAECLGFPSSPAFEYDGVSGFCYQSAPEAVAAEPVAES